MRHADRPEITEQIRVTAAPEVVWRIVSDIALPVGPSPELQAVEWLPGSGPEPQVGARFVGTNRNKFIGEWRMPCTITECDAPRAFAWIAGEGSEPITTWRFVIEAGADGGSTVTHWMQLGTGESGLTAAIASMPEKEERIVERRMQDFRTGILANLDAIRTAVESA